MDLPLHGPHELFATLTTNDEPLAAIRVEPGLESIELVLPQHRLEIDVRGWDGREPELTMWRGGREVSKLAIVRVDESERAYPREARIFRAKNTLVVPVEPDADYVVSWLDASVPVRSTRVRLRANEWSRKIELRLDAPTPPRELTVAVLNPDGQPFAPRRASLEIRFPGGVVESYQGWSRVAHRLVSDSWVVSMPPGSASITALAESASPFAFNRRDDLRPLFAPATIDLGTSDVASESIELQLRGAGYIDFETAEGGALYAHGARVSLASDSERIDGLTFYDAASSGREPIVPGAAARCLTPIPVGVWTLRVEAGDELLFEREIEVEEQRATIVRW